MVPASQCQQLCRLCLSKSEAPPINLYHRETKELTRNGLILKQHFWFDFGVNCTKDSLSAIICPKCWSYIEQFDQFYNLIKDKHQEYYGDSMHCTVEDDRIVVRYDIKRDASFLRRRIVAADVKEEPIDISTVAELSDHVIAIPFRVLEEVDNNCSNDNIKESADESGSSDDSTAEECIGKPSETMNAKFSDKNPSLITNQQDKTILTKGETLREQLDETGAADVELIRKYFLMECDKCEHSFNTYSDATLHYQNVHNLEPTYLCCMCDKKFSDLSIITQHCVWHENPSTYKGFICDICDKTFKAKSSLKMHLMRHVKAVIELGQTEKKTNRRNKRRKSKKTNRTHEESAEEQIAMLKHQFKMECDICEEKFENFRQVKSHFRMVHKQSGYLVCCKKRFLRMLLAIDHCKWHGNPDLFKCKECSKSFMDNIALEYHMSHMHTPDDQRQFKCDLCPRTFALERNLRGHRKKVHFSKRDEKIHECPICGKKYSLLTLRFHIENVHDNRHAQICDICGRSFKSAKCYEMHYLSEHTNVDQKVQCDLCGKWFKHQDGLKHHMRAHKAPTSQCKICGRISPNKAATRAHMRSAHRPASLKCTVCAKMFKNNTTLKEHEAMHFGINLYKCSFCSTTFRSSANMYKHRKQAHPVEYAEHRTAPKGSAMLRVASDMAGSNVKCLSEDDSQ